MEHPILAILTALALVTVTVPTVLAQDVSPRDPVVNSGFEQASPAGSALADTPLDECIGLGHQAMFGSQTPLGHLAGGPYDDPDPQSSDPQAAADRIATSPGDEALFVTGYGHCVANDEEGHDACWCNPAQLAGDEAIHWSGHEDDVVADLDGDGDREIQIAKGSGHHNIWQAWNSPHQAYTGDFEALAFAVEDGQVADNARVVISMSATPLQTQSPWVGLYYDCQLSFSADQFQTGTNSIAPTEGSLSSASPDCEDAVEAWNEGDDEDKAEVLGRLRIGQLSFWGFENVDTEDDEIVLDDISLAGATLAVEQAAEGNVNPNPTSQGLE